MSEVVTAGDIAPGDVGAVRAAIIVDSIDAGRAMGEGIDWLRLCKLPPFQMFIESIEPNPMGIPSDRFAWERAKAMATASGAEALYEKYAAWFNAKGCWPHETPYGEPR